MYKCTEILPGLRLAEDCRHHLALSGRRPAPPPARLKVELPPCKPHDGINTDWSGNKCSIRSSGQIADLAPASPQRVVLTPPQTGPEAPKFEQPAPQLRPNVGTVGQEPASGDDHASMSRDGYYLAVALILTLFFV